ncbi:hypothetical protein J7M22_09725, partial [Candidatus Poribacteria bacterium]|nr:hypothetical protein [Candidatus Poribacteria bacterium]
MRDKVVFKVTLGELVEAPGSPYAYWAPKSLRKLFKRFPPLDRDVAGMPDKPKIADVKVGLQTSDDLRFTRCWWEVPADEIATSREETFQGKRWVPFAKGGKPFFHDIQLVVNWGNDGEEIRNFSNAVIRNESFYFREGLAWVNKMAWTDAPIKLRLNVYHLPSGTIFACGYHAVFHENSDVKWSFLAWLRTPLTMILTVLIDPNIQNVGVGLIARLPVVESVFGNLLLASLAREGRDLLREWTTGDEISTVFIKPWLLQIWDALRGQWDEEVAVPRTDHPLSKDFRWSEVGKGFHLPWRITLGLENPPDLEEGGILALADACIEWERRLRTRIEEIQKRIDDEVYRLYDISDEDRALIEAELGENVEETEEAENEDRPPVSGLLPPEEHIRRLIHYLAHEAIREDPDGIVPLFGQSTADGRLEQGLAERVRGKLTELFGDGNGAEREIESALGKRLEDWLADDFAGYHTGLYRLRPIIWQVEARTEGRGQRLVGAWFVHWHKLDADTIPKIRTLYLRPLLEGAEREVERYERQLLEARQEDRSLREQREIERSLQDSRSRLEALRGLEGKLDQLLNPHALSVRSRSEWVCERVNEIVKEGYRPNRDYGVRVNIEPLKAAGVLHRSAERVKG